MISLWQLRAFSTRSRSMDISVVTFFELAGEA
jgi:hypothetical protein